MDRVGRDTPREGVRDTPRDTEAAPPDEGASREIADLRRMLAESERARAVAEALATERAREIERADRMLRLLEVRPAPAPAPETTPAPPPATPPTDAPSPPATERRRGLRERWRERWQRR